MSDFSIGAGPGYRDEAYDWDEFDEPDEEEWQCPDCGALEDEECEADCPSWNDDEEAA